MAKIYEQKDKVTNVDADGNITESIVERSGIIKRSDEPEYIKIYTRMWCDFNEIPKPQQGLFLELALRMSYANSCMSIEESQTVYTGEPIATAICRSLGWSSKNKSFWYKSLRILCECNAIRRVGRGIYQINPSYAGKGSWKYDSRMKSGGIEDLIATFDFKNHEVDTKIVWADDGTEVTKDFRENVGTGAVLKSRTFTPIQKENIV